MLQKKNPMRPYYKILDLPPVPLEFERCAFAQVQAQTNCLNPFNEEARDRWFIDRNGNPAQSGGFPRYNIGTDFDSWIRENICGEFIDGGVAFTEVLQRSMLGAHTDRTRKYSLLYLLQPGGAQVVTRWYQEPGHEILRSGNVFINDHRPLQLLTELEIPIRTWVCFNAHVIHSVEGIQSQRIGINISLNQDYFDLDRESTT
jgi:hypothetical protein